MYIDETIPMDFPMPEELKEYIEGMDKAFEENDDVTWDYYHEVIGEYAKNLCSAGEITTDQRNAIWEQLSLRTL